MIDRWLKTARGGITIGTVRTLVAVATAKSTVTLLALAFAIVVMRPPVVAEAMFAAARSVAIVTVTAKILASGSPLFRFGQSAGHLRGRCGYCGYC